MARLMDFVRGRRGTVFSMLLHVLVLAWGLLSFAPRPLEAKPPQDFIPVDVISAEQLSQITKGSKTGKKENQGALVEKIAPPKPDQDPVGKVNEKKQIAATSDATLPPEKKVEPKPVEKKQEEAKPIGEQLKKDPPKKPAEKQETKAAPKKEEKPKKEYQHDSSKIAALLDKRNPERKSATGETLNSNPGLGKANASAAKLSMSWVGALQSRIRQCWNVPAGVRDADNIEIQVYFELRRDGSVQGVPLTRAVRGAAASSGPAIAESAVRAIQQCQPYAFLPQSEYVGGWDQLDITFSSNDLFR
jgi:outer membrane biosynthesis protein TonB